MTDTAEYWQDVKTHREPNSFYHAKGVNCGHKHNIDTIYRDDVTCYACLNIIEIDNITMKEGKAPPTYYMTASARKRYNENKAFDAIHGTCSCGGRWTVRVNRLSKSSFLGCTNYPKCKKSKSI